MPGRKPVCIESQNPAEISSMTCCRSVIVTDLKATARISFCAITSQCGSTRNCTGGERKRMPISSLLPNFSKTTSPNPAPSEPNYRELKSGAEIDSNRTNDSDRSHPSLVRSPAKRPTVTPHHQIFGPVIHAYQPLLPVERSVCSI